MLNILYRGKRVDNGMWEEGYYCYKPDSNVVGKNNEQHYILKYHLMDWNLQKLEGYLVNPDTVCLSVGFKDKNGKHIYSNDVIIMRYNNFIQTSKVYYEKGSFYIIWRDDDGAYRFHTFKDIPDDVEFEVVGNIFDRTDWCFED